MSYQGFTKPIIHGFLNRFSWPRILEIGVDKGQTTFPFIQNFTSLKKPFCYTGVDILVRQEVIELLSQFHGIKIKDLDFGEKNKEFLVQIFEADSIYFLNQCLQSAELLSPQKLYDLVLLDGDHNYITVKKELELINSIINPVGLICVDDFLGRWSEKDMFYSEKEEYKNTPGMASRSEFSKDEKQGVRIAVEDFIRENPQWSGWTNNVHEPAFLYRNDAYEFPELLPKDLGALREKKFYFSHTKDFKEYLTTFKSEDFK